MYRLAVSRPEIPFYVLLRLEDEVFISPPHEGNVAGLIERPQVGLRRKVCAGKEVRRTGNVHVCTHLSLPSLYLAVLERPESDAAFCERSQFASNSVSGTITDRLLTIRRARGL